jgi:hypothetical protein
MDLEGTPGQRLGVYLAEPGTPDHDALLLLDMATLQPAATPPQTRDNPIQSRDTQSRLGSGSTSQAPDNTPGHP